MRLVGWAILGLALLCGSVAASDKINSDAQNFINFFYAWNAAYEAKDLDAFEQVCVTQRITIKGRVDEVYETGTMISMVPLQIAGPRARQFKAVIASDVFRFPKLGIRPGDLMTVSGRIYIVNNAGLGLEVEQIQLPVERGK